MNITIKTLTTAGFAIALITTSIALTTSSAEAGPRGFLGMGITNTDLGSGR